MIIFVSTNIVVKQKMWYQPGSSLRKRNKRLTRGFCEDYGDIPVCRLNDTTKTRENVVNNRGFAYALRNAQKYKKSKKEKMQKEVDICQF